MTRELGKHFIVLLTYITERLNLQATKLIILSFQSNSNLIRKLFYFFLLAFVNHINLDNFYINQLNANILVRDVARTTNPPIFGKLFNFSRIFALKIRKL